MKKDRHDLQFAIWIDSQKAMVIWDEPGGTHHLEVLHNELPAKERFDGEGTNKTGLFRTTLNGESHQQNRENEFLRKFVKSVAAKVRYAHTIYIMGSGNTRHLLQHELEGNKDLRNIILQNTPANHLTADEFEREARSLFEKEKA
jgi:hypothetical protein